MHTTALPRPVVLCVAAAMFAASLLWTSSPTAAEADGPGVVRCANLIYASNKTSVCFSDRFLVQMQEDTLVRTHRRFVPVKLESGELFDHPFAVMTGEGAFSLSDDQRQNLADYLYSGGFLVASAGCSSRPWNASFEREVAAMFPDRELTTLGADHPIFHTVYDITASRYKSGEAKLPELRALEIDGRVVMIWSPDGLNDTAHAGPDCCCCGGNEVKSARDLNVNILAYALTH